MMNVFQYKLRALDFIDKNYNNPYVILKDDVKCILSRSGLKNVMKYWI
ncbi:accessory gene regulator protein A [Clostridium tetani]|nr:hypothetical protein [Clostridium tetani]WFN62432.1 hypothetical protein PAA20_03015 [Clostridium tetani]SUY54618.1 accessory gene regulator protein A [Clostridium tetani]BDR71713.1 hypothetical protein K144316041_04210 [Clostridium tetani]BDR77490.1 hypothetical protein K154307017_04230 [Clostridium tetani]BDR83012.1 hypothetical protein K254310026_04230 [Clostridium tetani]